MITFTVMGATHNSIQEQADKIIIDFYGRHYPYTIDARPMQSNATGEILFWDADITCEGP